MTCGASQEVFNRTCSGSQSHGSRWMCGAATGARAYQRRMCAQQADQTNACRADACEVKNYDRDARLSKGVAKRTSRTGCENRKVSAGHKEHSTT